MADPPPFLNAFGPVPLGPGVRWVLGHVGRLRACEDLYALFGHLFSAELWARADEGRPAWRERVFSPQVTFWAFVSQVLSPASSCREVVRRVQGWWKRTTRETAALSGSSSASGPGAAGPGHPGVDRPTHRLELGTPRLGPGTRLGGPRG